MRTFSHSTVESGRFTGPDLSDREHTQKNAAGTGRNSWSFTGNNGLPKRWKRQNVQG